MENFGEAKTLRGANENIVGKGDHLDYFVQTNESVVDGKIVHQIEQFDGNPLTEKELMRMNFNFQKDMLRDELLSEIRLSSRHGGGEDRHCNIKLYMGVLRGIISRLLVINLCADKKVNILDKNLFGDKQLKEFARSNIKLNKLAKQINRELNGSINRINNERKNNGLEQIEVGKTQITFDMLWEAINKSRYSRSQYRSGNYVFSFTSYHSHITIRPDHVRGELINIPISVYRIIDCIESYVRSYFSDDKHNEKIKNYLPQHFDATGGAYCLMLPQDISKNVKDILAERAGKKVIDYYIRKLHSLLADSFNIPIRIVEKLDDLNGDGFLTPMFPVDMHESDFERWADDHVRKISKFIKEDIARELSDVDLISGQEIITQYSYNDLQNEIQSGAGNIIGSLLRDHVHGYDWLDRNDILISPIYCNTPSINRNENQYLAEYFIRDGGVSASITQLEICYIGHREYESNGTQVYIIKIGIHRKIDIIDPSKVYRFLFIKK